MVRTFEFEAGALRRSWSDPSLAEASASLPAGAYTTLRTYDGSRVLRLRQHVARLEESLALQGQAAQLSEAEARQALATALQACGHSESRLRVTFAPPRLFVSVEALVPLPESLYREGVACVTLPLQRSNPHAKDTRFIATASEAYASLPPGAHEGLLVTAAGEILEGLSSNFFGLIGGTLHTEGERALEGVTRSQMLELARGLVALSFDPFRVEQVQALSEAFLTSSSRGVLPVVGIDGRSVGPGAPGPLTLELKRRFDDVVRREAESLLPSA